MLEQNSLMLLIVMLMAISIKGLPVAEPVEQEQEIATTPSSVNLSAAGIADFGHVIYDQRQEGKYNIHVSIKDVAIIDMDQNKVEEDTYDEDEYYYEDGDYTVKPLIVNPVTNQTKVSTTAPMKYTRKPTSSQVLQTTLNTNTVAADIVSEVTTAELNTEEYATQTVTSSVKETDMQPKQNTENKSKIIHGSSIPRKEQRKEISRQTPESPIYKFKVPQLKHHKLQQTLAQLKEKEQQHQKQLQQQQQEQSFSKAFQNQLNQQHVRYPTPIHQFINLAHHKHQRQSEQTPHSHCQHANQYRDLEGNCQTRRAATSTSATGILRKFFNMLLTLPLRDREQEQQ